MGLLMVAHHCRGEWDGQFKLHLAAETVLTAPSLLNLSTRWRITCSSS